MGSFKPIAGDVVFSDAEGIKYDTPLTLASGYPVYRGISGANAGGGRTLLAVSPDGTRAAGCTGSSNPVQFYDLAGVDAMGNTNSSYTGAPRQIVWNPSGTRIAIPSSTSPFICEFDTATLTKLTALPAVAASAWAAAYSPDGSLLAVGHQTTPFLTVYDVATGTALSSPPDVPGYTVGALAFSLDGTKLFVACNSSAPPNFAYDTTTWARSDLPGGAQGASSKAIALSPDGEKLAIFTNQASSALRVIDLVGNTVRSSPSGYTAASITKGRWVTNNLLIIQQATGLQLIDYAPSTPVWLGFLNLGGAASDWTVMPGGSRRYLAGTVVDGDDDPAERQVRVMHRETGRIIAGTVSSASDGTFQMTVMNGQACIVLAVGAPGEATKMKDAVTPVTTLDPP